MKTNKNKILLGVTAFFGLFVAVQIVNSLLSEQFSLACTRMDKNVYFSPDKLNSVFSSERDCPDGKKLEILLGNSSGEGRLLVVYSQEVSTYKHQDIEYLYPPVGVTWVSNNEVSVKVGLGRNLILSENGHDGIKVNLLAASKP